MELQVEGIICVIIVLLILVYLIRNNTLENFIVLLEEVIIPKTCPNYLVTDGKFYYSVDGKILKAFGADDHDALSILKKYMNIIFVTGDKKGFKISKKRIHNHMGFKIFLVSTTQRLKWIKSRYKLEETIYIGDGLLDYLVMEKIGYSITPNNSSNFTKKYSFLRQLFNIDNYKRSDCILLPLNAILKAINK